jgi:alkanesulfonate monooxygenase SsuD/methylene tetrahydromethanopterin reductase-like flavin-dependent oxidoreductase (luciferase family)
MTPVGDLRQPRVTGTAFALRDAWQWAEFAGLAKRGEDLGYRAVFVPEIAGRDAFASLVGLAGETSRLLLGTGVVPMTSRRASTTAMGAATVQERSGGRAILGIGTGPPRPAALEALREQVTEIRERLAPVDAREDPRGAPARLALERPVPVWTAALGPRALALSGAVSDGVLLNWCTPERVAEARVTIARAAEDAGRDPAAVTVATYIRSAVGSDDEAARRALAAAAGGYASYPAYRRQFEAMGLGRAAAAAAAAATGGDPGASDGARALIEGVCLSGDPAIARARLAAYADAGCDLRVVYPVAVTGAGAGSVVASLEALAPDAEVLARG